MPGSRCRSRARPRSRFVTDGIGAALDQARKAAGDLDVAVAGAASAAQQYLRAGLLDELQPTSSPCSSATVSGCSTTLVPTGRS